jgi:hypothetical protein
MICRHSIRISQPFSKIWNNHGEYSLTVCFVSHGFLPALIAERFRSPSFPSAGLAPSFHYPLPHPHLPAAPPPQTAADYSATGHASIAQPPVPPDLTAPPPIASCPTPALSRFGQKRSRKSEPRSLQIPTINSRISPRNFYSAKPISFGSHIHLSKEFR